MPSQDPAERVAVARIGSHAQKAKHDSRELTKNARAASPGSLGFWEREVDPDGHLDPLERPGQSRPQGRLWLARSEVGAGSPEGGGAVTLGNAKAPEGHGTNATTRHHDQPEAYTCQRSVDTVSAPTG